MPSRIRTKGVTARLTPDEHQAVRSKAQSCGYSPSEYARIQLLASLNLSSDARFIGAELLAFQEVFLALISASLRGEALDDGSVARIRSRFDSVKESLVERTVRKRNDAARKERLA
jgi:hypothetical protein